MQFRPSRQTGSLLADLVHRGELHLLASTTVTAPLPSTSSVLSGPMKAAVSSSRPMPMANGL
jgi:hypothetical protein